MITLTKTINKLPKNPLLKTNKVVNRFEMNIKTITGNHQQASPQAPYFYHFFPDGPHSAAAAGAPDRRGLLRGRRPMRLRAARGAEAEAHHDRDSDKYHAVRSMLDDLPKLADHYLTWTRRTRPVSMTRREELEHRAATHCRECLASFETAEKKLHHCHGTGQYLGALCHSCNIAAQTPKTIPVVFHNGGGYDFHFLLRYIATMGSPVSRAPREELGEDSDDEGSESEASEPEMAMAKAAPKAKVKAKAAPKPLTGWCALQAAIKQGDYSHLCLRVLCKSGEKCLQAPLSSWTA